MNPADMRQEYTRGTLTEESLPAEPLPLFREWFEAACAADIPEPNAMTLATVDSEGQPWNRIVLPNGQMVRINYPATDRNGTAGVEGKVHNNTLGRMAGAVLQTALNTASFGLLNRSTGGTVVVGAPMPQLAPGTQRTSSRRITVPAGTAVNAFVAQPIDFSPADA